jgi:hypothetical protein
MTAALLRKAPCSAETMRAPPAVNVHTRSGQLPGWLELLAAAPLLAAEEEPRRARQPKAAAGIGRRRLSGGNYGPWQGQGGSIHQLR